MNVQVHVVEWSFRQKLFHITTLTESIKNNRRSMRTGVETDYICVGMAGSHDDAVTLCHNLKPEAKGYVPIPFDDGSVIVDDEASSGEVDHD